MQSQLANVTLIDEQIKSKYQSKFVYRREEACCTISMSKPQQTGRVYFYMIQSVQEPTTTVHRHTFFKVNDLQVIVLTSIIGSLLRVWKSNWIVELKKFHSRRKERLGKIWEWNDATTFWWWHDLFIKNNGDKRGTHLLVIVSDNNIKITVSLQINW